MRRRRAIIVFVVGAIILILFGGALPRMIQESLPTPDTGLGITNSETGPEKAGSTARQSDSALGVLGELEVKGRAPKTGYARAQFGDGWDSINGCTTRNIILHRDLYDVVVDDTCRVISGTLLDPYSGEKIMFTKERSADVQIDHVVALSDAWQKGAQLLTPELRKQLANDPLELLAVSGSQNQAKGDGDAATWLPKNKSFRCEYIARQIAIKKKYTLWVTEAEKTAMKTVLEQCAPISLRNYL